VKAVPRIAGFVSVLVLICACNQPTPTSTPPPPTEAPTPTPKPAPKVLADTFFFGHAYLDANGNEKIDPEDPGLEGALFEVALSGGGSSASRTGKDGSAVIVIPGGVSQKGWPVRARMRPPPDADYELVGPEELALQYPQVSADFLFVALQQGE